MWYYGTHPTGKRSCCCMWTLGVFEMESNNLIINKNAFQQDAYCPLQWPSLLPCMPPRPPPPPYMPHCNTCNPTMYAPLPCMPHHACPHHGQPPPMDRMTDACENITLPQTSFVGGNKKMGLLCITKLYRSFLELLMSVRILCWVCIIKCSILPKLFLLYLWTHSVSK